MKKYLMISLIFVVSVTLLQFYFFQFWARLASAFGAVSLNHFLINYISSPKLFSLIMKPYLYFSIFIPNIIPIIIFFLVGLILSKYFRAWWQVLIFSIILMIFNWPQLIFDTFPGFPTRFDILGIIMFINLVYFHPVYALFGYYIGSRNRGVNERQFVK